MLDHTLTFILIFILSAGVTHAQETPLVPFQRVSIDQRTEEQNTIFDVLASKYAETVAQQQLVHAGDFATRSNGSHTFVQSFSAPHENQMEQTDYWMGVSHVADGVQSNWALTLEGECTLDGYASVLAEESGVVVASDGLYMLLLVEGIDGSWVSKKLYVARLDHSGTANCLGEILVDEYYDGIGAYMRTFYQMRESGKVAVSGIVGNTLYIDRTITFGNRNSGYTFTDTYAADQDSLFISQSTRPESFISQVKADSIYQDLLSDYYSAYWDSVASKEGGSADRAFSFLYRFGDLSVLRPGFAPGHYNAACMLAILENHGQAIAFLEEAIRLDPDYLDKARRDPDLKGLRELKAFKRLIGE